MIDWVTVLSLGLIPVSAFLLAGWSYWLNRDLMKPQESRPRHTPAE